MGQRRIRILLLSLIDIDHPYGSHIRPYFLSYYLPSAQFYIVSACGKGKKELPSFNFVNRKWLKFRTHPAIRYSVGLLDTYNLIRRFNPDLIYAHGYTLGFIASTVMKLSKLKLLKKTPIIVDLHGSAVYEQIHNSPGSNMTAVLSFLERSALAGADWITPASENIKEFIVSFYGISSKKVTTIPNGVCRENFFPLSHSARMKLRTEAKVQDKKVVILVAPRESAKTNDWSMQAIRIMYEVMQKLWAVRKDIVLQIVGGGPTLKNPPPNVSYLKFVRDLNAFLNLADLAIVPYPEWLVCGGARNKVLEFFASRLPVVSTTSGVFGIPEAEPFKNYIPTTYSPEDITNKILLALEMKEENLRRIKDNALQLILTKYTWEKSSRLLSKTLVSLSPQIIKRTETE